MAAVKFAKGSEEWQMFMDYWALCQKYWKPEDTDKYWEELLREVHNFADKHGNTEFVIGLCTALINYLEAKDLSGNKRNGKS